MRNLKIHKLHLQHTHQGTCNKAIAILLFPYLVTVDSFWNCLTRQGDISSYLTPPSFLLDLIIKEINENLFIILGMN